MAEHRRSARGASIIEFAIFLSILLLLVGGALDIGLGIADANLVANATRTGARVASQLIDLTADDPRVIDAVRKTLQTSKSISEPLTITNTAPVSRYNIKNQNGKYCDEDITVSISAVHRSYILRMFGVSGVPLAKSLSMHHNNGQICN